jgi:hypothetical protein
VRQAVPTGIPSDATAAFDAAERAMWEGRAAAYADSFGRLCAHPVEALLDAADAGMVAAARERGVGARVAVLPELPFADGEFDAVVATSYSTTSAARAPRSRSCAEC